MMLLESEDQSPTTVADGHHELPSIQEEDADGIVEASGGDIDDNEAGETDLKDNSQENIVDNAPEEGYDEVSLSDDDDEFIFPDPIQPVAINPADPPKSNRTNDTNESRDTNGEKFDDQEAIRELVEILRHSEEDIEHLPKHVKKRVRDFRFAQKQRRRRYTFRKHGTIGLFANLQDIRQDLRWAEDAAYRREHGLAYLSWLDFEATRSTGLRRPLFSYTVAIVSIVMMVVTFYKNDWKIERLDVNPFLGPSPEILIELGAMKTDLLVVHGEWYRILSAIFLHAGIIHLVLNVGSILFICGAVEKNHGRLNTAILFLVSAIGGNLMSGVMQPGYVLIGASGGIFGVFGVCLADIVLNWKLLFLLFRKDEGGFHWCLYNLLCVFTICFDVAINSIVGFTPYVDNFAHMTGLVYGFLLGLTILKRLPLSFFGKASGFSHMMRIVVFRVFGAATACFLILISAVLLDRSDGITSPCSNCRYISCIPFPIRSEKKWWYCDGCNAVEADAYFDERGDDYYAKVDVFCPDGGIATVDVYDMKATSGDEIIRKLPGYCQDYC
jgi:membrane associated rhomboid family serine protease